MSRSWLRDTPGRSSGTRKAVTPRAPAVGAGAGEEHGGLRDHGQADARLLARDQVAVAVPLGATGEVGGVRSGAGLGQGEGDDLLSTRGGREPSRLDLLGAGGAHDLAGQPRELNAVGAPEISAGDFLHGEAEGHVVRLLASVGGGNAQAEEAQLAHLAPGRPRELPRAVPVARSRRQLLARESAKRLDQLVLLGGECEIHGSLESTVR